MAETTPSAKTKKVIDVLNSGRGLEINAIAQYMNHHYNLARMDYGDMAAKIKLIAIDEMKHAKMFAERIMELGGEPTTKPEGKPEMDHGPDVIFKADTLLEVGAIKHYNKFIAICRENNDSTSEQLFKTIIDKEQEHFDYFDSVREHIAKLGDAYLAQIAGTSSSSGITYNGFVDKK